MDNVCSICHKKFTAKKNLMKHLRNVHKNFSEAERMIVKKIRCPQSNCDFICRMMKELRSHIETNHKIKILKDILEFPNESLFQKWKKEEETNTISWFVTGRKKTTLIDGRKKQILYCHRTGHYSPKGFGKYRMRLAGSCKIGVTCPASMEIVESSDGHLTVIYYKTHFGHEKDVVYLKLSREERANIAEKIKQGFTFDAILEEIKESIDNSDLKKKKIHFLSKKDLYSIMRSCHRTSKEKNFKKGCEKLMTKSTILTEINECRVEEQKTIFEGFTNEKLNGKIQQQNFTLHAGEGVIFPQEYFAPNNSSTLAKPAKEISNLSQSANNQISSQILILSRDMNYNPVTEIVLLSSTDSVAVSGKVSQTQRNESTNSSNILVQTKLERSEEDIKKTAKMNLRNQLQEKLNKINDLLHRSSFLTPKQFSLIEIKMGAILNMLLEADAKAKSKAEAKIKSKKRKMQT